VSHAPEKVVGEEVEEEGEQKGEGRGSSKGEGRRHTDITCNKTIRGATTARVARAGESRGRGSRGLSEGQNDVHRVTVTTRDYYIGGAIWKKN
jgi:hypothetical protein